MWHGGPERSIDSPSRFQSPACIAEAVFNGIQATDRSTMMAHAISIFRQHMGTKQWMLQVKWSLVTGSGPRLPLSSTDKDGFSQGEHDSILWPWPRWMPVSSEREYK